MHQTKVTEEEEEEITLRSPSQATPAADTNLLHLGALEPFGHIVIPEFIPEFIPEG